MGEMLTGVIILGGESKSRDKKDEMPELNAKGLWVHQAVNKIGVGEITGYVHPESIIEELKIKAANWDIKPVEVVPATFDLETGKVAVVGEIKPFQW